MTDTSRAARPLHRLDPRRALSRFTISLAVGIGAAMALSTRFNGAVAALGGWDAGAVVILALAWLNIARRTPAETRAHAGSEDPGRTAVLVLVTATSLVSLLAATLLSRRAGGHAAGDGALLVGLCLATVALSWLLTQTSFTTRYAHLYYRGGHEGAGGIDFPGGGAPRYLDFAYFAFTVGMCFQVSDCVVKSWQIRRAVLVHALLSYTYTTVILAFVLNLVFGAASS